MGSGRSRYDEAFARFGRRLHRQRHRIEIGIKACPNILDIEDQDIDVRQHLGSRLFDLAVETVHGQAGGGVGPAVHLDPRRFRAAQAVLGTEQGDHAHARHLAKDIDDVRALAVVRGVISDDPDPFAFE